jgi:hypothetical protein
MRLAQNAQESSPRVVWETFSDSSPNPDIHPSRPQCHLLQGVFPRGPGGHLSPASSEYFAQCPGSYDILLHVVAMSYTFYFHVFLFDLFLK